MHLASCYHLSEVLQLSSTMVTTIVILWLHTSQFWRRYIWFYQRSGPILNRFGFHVIPRSLSITCEPSASSAYSRRLSLHLISPISMVFNLASSRTCVRHLCILSGPVFQRAVTSFKLQSMLSDPRLSPAGFCLWPRMGNFKIIWFFDSPYIDLPVYCILLIFCHYQY